MKTKLFYTAALLITTMSINAQGTWMQKANFNTERIIATGFSIGTKGYMGMGQDNAYAFKKDFWEYDPGTDTWTQKADFGGTARGAATGFAIGTKGYIGTGAGTSYYKDFWEYDPAANTWVQKADFGGTARYGSAGFSIGTKGYIGTGYSSPGTDSLHKDFWEWDQGSNTWTQKADFAGTARGGAIGFSIDSKGYIGTGCIGPNYYSYCKDFWEYDPTGNTWTQKTDFGGEARGSAVGFAIDAKGYIGTGKDTLYNSRKDLWEYDPSGNTWTQKANFGGLARGFATGFSIGTKGYIGTGHTGNGSKDFWEYDHIGTTGVGMLLEKSLSVSLFPNPVSDYLYISTPDSYGDANALSVEVYDLAGHLLIKEHDLKETVTKLDFSVLAAGVYVVKINSVSKKIIKQ